MPSFSCDSILIGNDLLTVTGGGLFVNNVSQTGAAAQQSTLILSGNLIQTGILLTDKIDIISGNLSNLHSVAVLATGGSQAIFGNKSFNNITTIAATGSTHRFEVTSSGTTKYLVASSIGFNLYGRTGKKSIDVENRYLYDRSEALSIDYNLRTLYGSGTSTLNYENKTLYNNWYNDAVPTISGHIVNKGFVDSGNLVGKTLFVDSVYGNDATALRQRRDKPFANPTGAKYAAISGDTIFVKPGYYNSNNLLKDYVNWYFEPGAIINYQGTGYGAIWDDSVYGLNDHVHCKIQGHGRFIYEGSGSVGHISRNVFYITNPQTHLDVNCEEAFLRSEIEGDAGLNGAIVISGGYIKFRGHAIEATDNGSVFFPRVGVLWQGNSSFDIGVERIYVDSPNGTPYGIWVDGATSGNGWINVNHITSQNYQGVASTSTTSRNATLYVNAMTIQTFGIASSNPIVLLGGKNFITANLITGGGDTCIHVGDGSFETETFIKSLSIMSMGSSSVGVSVGNKAILTMEGGTISTSGIGISMGTNCTGKFKNVSINTFLANTASINKQSGVLILKDCDIVSHPSSVSISGVLTPQTVKLYGHCMANKEKHSNITFSPSGAWTVDSNVI